MKKLIIFLLILNLISLAAFANGNNNEKLEELTISMSHHWRAADMDVYLDYFGNTKRGLLLDCIKDVTNGRVTVNEFPHSTLHKLKNGLSAASSGLTDLAFIWFPTIPGKFPQMELFSLPGLMTNQTISGAVLEALFAKYPTYSEMFDNEKVVLWQVTCEMRSDLHTIKPMNNLSELKGKVIACQNEQGAKALSLLGASTTIMVGQDAYLSAERGVIDGIFAAWGWVNAFSLKEVAPYSIPLRICPGTGAWIFNRDTWNKFTPYEQKMFKLCKYKRMQTHQNIMATKKAKKQQAEENYIEWSQEDMNKVRSTFEPIWKEWSERMEKLGYPGNEILEDTQRLIQDLNVH